MSEVPQQQRGGGRGGHQQREGHFRDSGGRRGGFSTGGRGAYGHRGGGGGGGGHRGGFGQHSGGASGGGDRKRESILNLTKHMDKAVLVKFQGGREVSGILKGFDPLTNLVLDDTTEILREIKEDAIYEHARTLGLVVARGPTVVMISPLEGTEEIENPFVNYMGEEDPTVS